MTIELHGRLGGRYKLEAVKPDGSRRVLADWFDNVITDVGLENLATQDQIPSQGNSYCYVGTGSSPALESNTALEAQIAYTDWKRSDDQGVQPIPPYFGWRRLTWRFGAGTATGNLSEVGVGRNADGTDIFSRALIKDSFGAPTTITVLEEEALDVTYELRMYPPLDDTPYSIVVAGNVHSGVIRAYRVNSNEWRCRYGGRILMLNSYSGDDSRVSIQFSNGSINSIDGGPLTGNLYTRNSQYGSTGSDFFAPPYSGNSKEVFFTVMYGQTSGNLAGGYSAGTFRSHNLGAFQFSIDPPIMKDGTKNFSMTYKLTWGRYVP